MFLLQDVKNWKSEDRHNLVVKDGLIDKILPAANNTNGFAGEVINCQGRVIMPSFVECHIHLEKAYIEDRMPNQSGTLQEAIANTSRLKKDFTEADIYTRAKRVINNSIRFGTTHLRAHVELEPMVGLIGYEVIRTLSDEYKDQIEIQIVAFPQDGIFKTPGTKELMEEVASKGADAIGGVPYVDDDPARHIGVIFDMAEKHALPLDLHVDFSDKPEDQTIRIIAEETIKRGMEGKVTVGHLTSLGSMEVPLRDEIIDLIAEAHINVVVLPVTDLYLNGRGDEYAIRRGLTAVNPLLEKGVTVAAGTNNIRNAFTPFNNGNLLTISLFYAVAVQLGSKIGQLQALEAVTTNAAQVMGLERYGFTERASADLVVLDETVPSEILSNSPPCFLTMKAGKIVVHNS